MTLRYREAFSLRQLRVRQTPRRRRLVSAILLHLGFLLLFVTSFFFANLYAAQEFLPKQKEVHPPVWVRKPEPKQSEPPVSTAPAEGPMVCLIMDDVGRDGQLLNQILKVPFPLTISVLPDYPYSRDSAVWAHNQGYEVMLHLPMQPKLYPKEDPGQDALLLSMNRNQLQQATEKALGEVPYAVGVNNHMGSRFTRNRAKLNVVMDILAQQHLYFIDSRTSTDSVAYELAHRKGIPSSERTLFLDDVNDPVPIRQRFQELIQTARQEGQAVGICHFRPETISALSGLTPDSFRDIRFTFASQVVQ